jgi:hypothetical protein
MRLMFDEGQYSPCNVVGDAMVIEDSTLVFEMLAQALPSLGPP